MNRATRDLIHVKLPGTILFGVSIAVGAVVIGVMIKLYLYVPSIPHEVLIALSSPAIFFVFGGFLWLCIIWCPELCNTPVNVTFFRKIVVQAGLIKAPLWVIGLLLFTIFAGVGFFWVF